MNIFWFFLQPNKSKHIRTAPQNHERKNCRFCNSVHFQLNNENCIKHKNSFSFFFFFSFPNWNYFQSNKTRSKLSHMLDFCGKLSVKLILKHLLPNRRKKKYLSNRLILKWLEVSCSTLDAKLRHRSKSIRSSQKRFNREKKKPHTTCACVKYWKCWHLQLDEGINRIRRA